MNKLNTDLYSEIVIFNSPIYREHFDDGENYLPPLGQGYIVTNLQQHGIRASLVDCVYNKMGVHDIVSFIESGTFEYAGFNVFSVNLEIIREILTGIKRKLHIFIGGKAAEYVWEDIVNWETGLPITFIIGEGELIFPHLLIGDCSVEPIFQDGTNCVYKVDQTSIYFPENLDNVTINRSIFRGREILNRFNRLESCIITSRGCIYDCAFCGGARSSNPSISARVRSPESIVQEINCILADNPNVRSIRVLDDLFLRNKHSIQTAIRIFTSFSDLHWRCMAHINSFNAADDYLAPLKSSGCDEVFIGIESGSPIIRGKINKIGSIDQVIQTVTKILSVGIDVKAYFICGFPSETLSQVQETVQLASHLKEVSQSTPGNFRAVAFQFRPYHGTKLYSEIITAQHKLTYQNSSDLASSKRQYNFSAGNFSDVSDEELKKAIVSILSLNNQEKS